MYKVTIKCLPTTHHASVVGGATECNGQHRRTLFTVVWHRAIFTDGANRYCIHCVGVTVVVAVVTNDATVSASNDVNGSISTATKLDAMPHSFDGDVLRSIDCFAVVLRTPATTTATNRSKH